ncbi:hypothetical protein IGI04_017372, partial [Brassica rapa subsp. trilocularis]
RRRVRFPSKVTTFSASHRRLIRRRLLSQCSASSPPGTMKKKKPKKSPTKLPAKSSPKTSSSAELISAESDLTTGADVVVSDAQIDSPVDKDAQQFPSAPDLGSIHSENPPCMAVIDANSSDPPSNTSLLPSDTLKLSSEGTNQSPSKSDKEERTTTESAVTPPQANVDARTVSSSSHLATATPVDQASGAPITPVTFAVQSISGADQNLAKETSAEDGNHLLVNCPHNRNQEAKGKKTRRGKSKDKKQWRVVEPSTDLAKKAPATTQTDQTHTEIVHRSLLGTAKDQVTGESSGTPSYLQSTRPRRSSRASKSSNSDIQPDSSDVETSDSDLEEGEFS